MKKKKGNKFSGKVATDSSKQKSDGRSYGYLKIPKGVDIFKQEAGKTSMFLDIIPYVVTDKAHPDRDEKFEIAMEGEPWYKRPFKVHRNIGSQDETVVCPTSIGKKCPICEYRLRRQKEGADKEELEALRPKDRILYNVIPLGHKKMEETIHLWDISKALFQNLLNEVLSENEEYEGFPDVEDGHTLKVKFKEEKFGKNTYTEASIITFTQRESQYDPEIMDSAVNLDEVLNILSYKDLEKLFLDMDNDVDEEDAEDEEDDQPKKKSNGGTATNGKTKSKTAKKVVEEEDDDEEDEEDEEEEKPVKKGKPAPAAKKGKATAQECPNDYTFGKDCDKYEECDDCPLWDACTDAQAALKTTTRKK